MGAAAAPGPAVGGVEHARTTKKAHAKAAQAKGTPGAATGTVRVLRAHMILPHLFHPTGSSTIPARINRSSRGNSRSRYSLPPSMMGPCLPWRIPLPDSSPYPE